MTRYERGLKPLSNRAEYCAWISLDEKNSSISSAPPKAFAPQVDKGDPGLTLAEDVQNQLWAVGTKLRPYRNKKIKFTYFPKPMEETIAKKQFRTEMKLKRINSTREILLSEMSELSKGLNREVQRRSYEKWKLQYELPQQLARLEVEKRASEESLQSFQERSFSDAEVYELLRETYSIDVESGETNIPFLAVEIELINGFFAKEVRLYPFWVEGHSRNRASSEPYFSLSGSMVPSHLSEAFKEKAKPPIYRSYVNLLGETFWSQSSVRLPANQELEASKIARTEYIDDHHILVFGFPSSNRLPEQGEDDFIGRHFTSSSNFAIDAWLDLACVHDSPWAKKLVRNSDLFLKNAQAKAGSRIEDINNYDLLVLNTLREFNRSGDKNVFSFLKR